MELPFSPTKDINLIQRNIKIPKKIKIKSKRFLNYYNKETNQLKIKRICK